MTAAETSRTVPRERSVLRSVAIPAEHGGWGLTLEPVLLGLLLAPSAAGALLGLAAFVAFLARTPLKVLLVDAHRGRRSPRALVARRLLAAEAFVLGGAVLLARSASAGPFWQPLVVIGPLVLVELWYDMRSRSRRLVPELAGAIGISGLAAVIVLAGDHPRSVAIAAWLVLAARSISAIAMVREWVMRIHGRPTRPVVSFTADLVALAVVAIGTAIEHRAAAGAALVIASIAVQRLMSSRPLPRVVVIGMRESVLGIAVVLGTAAGMRWGWAPA